MWLLCPPLDTSVNIHTHPGGDLTKLARRNQCIFVKNRATSCFVGISSGKGVTAVSNNFSSRELDFIKPSWIRAGFFKPELAQKLPKPS